MIYSKKRQKSIAIIGSRGIPNNYGGFECFTENISQKLAQKNYEVHVSCELTGNDPPKKFKDVNLFYFPIKHPKSNILGMFYEVMYDAYSLIYASLKADQVYMLGYSASIFFFIPKLFGKKLYLNPDGFEWKRNKFHGIVKFMLKIQERIGVFWVDKIIADSMGIKRYYDKKYGKSSKFIAYGVSEIPKINWNEKHLPESLKNGVVVGSNYWLLIARLEPENNIHIIVEGYLKSRTKKPLVIVGNFLNSKYEKTIHDMIDGTDKDKKIVFTGGIYNQNSLNMLRQNCFGYLHGHSVGGTNPSLIEAMIMKNVLLIHRNQFNEEVCQDSALYFKDSDEFKTKMDDIDSFPERYRLMKLFAFFRAKNVYSWEKIVAKYDGLFSRECTETVNKQDTTTKLPLTQPYNLEYNSK